MMMALTVFIISASYSQTIDHVPTGGGGYLVATKLLGTYPGLISGCALVVDYVLTDSDFDCQRRRRDFQLSAGPMAALQIPVCHRGGRR